MLTNNQMVAGRFLRWAAARKKVGAIKRHLAAGRYVYICTMTRATKLTAKHIDMVKATKTGAWMQRGRNWVNIDYCGIQVFSKG